MITDSHHTSARTDIPDTFKPFISNCNGKFNREWHKMDVFISEHLEHDNNTETLETYRRIIEHV